jgi:hypothetical protein
MFVFDGDILLDGSDEMRLLVMFTLK